MTSVLDPLAYVLVFLFTFWGAWNIPWRFNKLLLVFSALAIAVAAIANDNNYQFVLVYWSLGFGTALALIAGFFRNLKKDLK